MSFDSRRVSSTGLLLAVILAGAAVVLGVNLLAPRELPAEPTQRAELLAAAELYAEADAAFEALVENDPENLDWHYRYITNHFEIPDTEDAPRDDTAILDRYQRLADDPATADLGRYGLGLIASVQGEYEQALTRFEEVENRSQKYLNNSTGRVLMELGELEQAEQHLWREVELDGNVAGAVSNLVELYARQRRVDGLRRLQSNERTQPFMTYDALRRLALADGAIPRYLGLAFLSPFRTLSIPATLGALLIGAMWVFFFWRVDIFEQEKPAHMAAALILGVIATLFTTLVSDGLAATFAMRMSGDWLNDLIFAIVHIGLVEETIKLLPLFLIVWTTDAVNEPLDLMIYGGLSALGFATLENALYFSGYGLGIAFARFMMSTTMHLALTGIVAYLWGRQRFVRRRNEAWGVLGGLALATLAHGAFDYFILGPVSSLSGLSLLLVLVLSSAYGHMLRKALRTSPFYQEKLLSSRRLRNLPLMIGTGVLVLLIAFLYNHAQFSTAIANQKLQGMTLGMGQIALAIFLPIGVLRIREAEQTRRSPPYDPPPTPTEKEAPRRDER